MHCHVLYSYKNKNGGKTLDERLLQKMIRNCFLQYYDCEESIPLSVFELKAMISKIKNRQKNGEETIHELIEDAVYEYVTMKE